jgi:hypothetical protein
MADAVELRLQVLAVLLGEDALDDRGRLRTAEAPERLDDAWFIPGGPRSCSPG